MEFVEYAQTFSSFDLVTRDPEPVCPNVTLPTKNSDSPHSTSTDRLSVCISKSIRSNSWTTGVSSEWDQSERSQELAHEGGNMQNTPKSESSGMNSMSLSEEESTHHIHQIPSLGRWTEEEHALFLEGLKRYGKVWKKIAEMMQTRTVVQVRTHAQKYFLKLKKMNGGNELSNEMLTNNQPLPHVPMAHAPADSVKKIQSTMINSRRSTRMSARKVKHFHKDNALEKKEAKLLVACKMNENERFPSHSQGFSLAGLFRNYSSYQDLDKVHIYIFLKKLF